MGQVDNWTITDISVEIIHVPGQSELVLSQRFQLIPVSTGSDFMTLAEGPMRGKGQVENIKNTKLVCLKPVALWNQSWNRD